MLLGLCSNQNNLQRYLKFDHGLNHGSTRDVPQTNSKDFELSQNKNTEQNINKFDISFKITLVCDNQRHLFIQIIVIQ